MGHDTDQQPIASRFLNMTLMSRAVHPVITHPEWVWQRIITAPFNWIAMFTYGITLTVVSIIRFPIQYEDAVLPVKEIPMWRLDGRKIALPPEFLFW